LEKQICSVFASLCDWFCMKEEQHRFLSLLGQLPARLTAEQAVRRVPKVTVTGEGDTLCQKGCYPLA